MTGEGQGDKHSRGTQPGQRHPGGLPGGTTNLAKLEGWAELVTLPLRELHVKVARPGASQGTTRSP